MSQESVSFQGRGGEPACHEPKTKRSFCNSKPPKNPPRKSARPCNPWPATRSTEGSQTSPGWSICRPDTGSTRPTQHQPQPWIQGVVPASQTRFRFDGTPARRRPFCFASPRERNPISTNSSGSLVMICSGPNSGAASALAGGMMECTFRP